MFAHQRKKVELLFAVADIVLTIFSFEFAYQAREGLPLGYVFFLTPEMHFLLLAFCSAIWAVLGQWNRIYEFVHAPELPRTMRVTLRQALLGTAALVVFQYALRLELSRSFLLLFLGANVFLLTAYRWLSPRLLSSSREGFGASYHLVLIGSEERTKDYARRVCESTPFRTQVTACLSVEDCPNKLPMLLRESVVDEVIFTVDGEALRQLENVFLLCDEQGVRTRVAIDFFPHVNSQVSLDRVGGKSLLTFSAAPTDDPRLMVKRIFDILLASAGLVLLAPILLLCAVLVKVSSAGPIIFKQPRCGLNGRHFTLLKFRSMVKDAAALRKNLEHLNERQVAFKIAQDPRVTSVGRWLRKFSLDELPQLVNVLKGDMSIVGPRPPLLDEVERYQLWQRRRLRMRPGLTCLWAIAGRDRLDFTAWMRLDISYIENWSLGLDWSIILKTIPRVISGRGAH